MRAAKEAGRPALSERQHAYIDELAQNLKFGTITLVFQDGVLVQIDRSEKIRVPRETPAGLQNTGRAD